MKNSIKTIATTIIVLMTAFSTTYGKTKKMSAAQFDLVYKHTDKKLVGTWEKASINFQSKKTEYCQFNANGTYISFEKKDAKISITGKGSWLVKADEIYIIHGNEKTAPVKYTVENNQLVFEDAAQYTKPAVSYASK
jgi:hypothetical protein